MMKKMFLIILMSIALVFQTSCMKQDHQNPRENQIDEIDVVDENDEQQQPEPSYEERIINSMDMDEKIGQLVIIGFSEGTPREALINAIKKDKIGGFILFRRNYDSFKSMYDLVSELKDLNKNNPLPLFIAVDEEGGTVSRIPKEGVTMPDAKKFGDINDLTLTEKSGSIIGKQLYSAGINMNFAPVLDILSRDDNTLLKRRSYGKDVDRVSAHGISFIKGLTKEGIIPVPKHFPGHGHTKVDSHGGLPVINIDRNTLDKRELVPFRYTIDKGLDAIMIGHLAFPQIDPSGKPATRSKIFVTDILKNELGFKGIAISDEIEMIGFTSGKDSIEDAVIESFNAGIDVFVIGHSAEIQQRVLKALKNGVSTGLITEERINEALTRIVQVKRKYNLSDEMNVDFETAYKLFADEEYKSFVEDIKRR